MSTLLLCCVVYVLAKVFPIPFVDRWILDTWAKLFKTDETK